VAFDVLKRVVVGSPVHNQRAAHSLLPKWLALPIFASDALSSVAYATEEILLVLILGGLAAMQLTPWVALAVILLLIIVVTSYRKTVYAYPGGGGDYQVAQENFGQKTALVAAAALVVDYVVTVAVSISSGVANLISAFPALDGHAVPLCVGFIVLLTMVNLRGVKESGFSFAMPTYLFITTVVIMLVTAAIRFATGNPPVAMSAIYPVETQELTTIALIFLLLRAFASGCTALTGVEAVSNGVPFFRVPKSRNASITLMLLGGIAIFLFGGITILAVATHVHVAEDPSMIGQADGFSQTTVIAQLGAAVFGSGSLGFYALQIFTMTVLILAANTAFNGFPILASVLGRDGYLPRQFGRRGDRLVFSNGIIILASAAVVLVIVFDASVTRLVQLYILGVFLSFTISQAGMVRHWNRLLLRVTARRERLTIYRSRVINAVGATVTGLVLVIVIITKAGHGAWLVIVVIPLIVLLMMSIHRHYVRTDEMLEAPVGNMTLPSRVHAVVLVSRVNSPAMLALSFARAARPDTLVGLHVQTDRSNVASLEAEWERRGIPVPLVVVDSPFRDVTTPIVEYVRRLKEENPGDLIAVYIPEYVVSHWWEGLLHNQSAIRLKARLLFQSGVVTTSVPTLLAGKTEPPQRGGSLPPRSSAFTSE
jgi:amino acid transporter